MSCNAETPRAKKAEPVQRPAGFSRTNIRGLSVKSSTGINRVPSRWRQDNSIPATGANAATSSPSDSTSSSRHATAPRPLQDRFRIPEQQVKERDQTTPRLSTDPLANLRLFQSFYDAYRDLRRVSTQFIPGHKLPKDASREMMKALQAQIEARRKLIKDHKVRSEGVSIKIEEILAISRLTPDETEHWEKLKMSTLLGELETPVGNGGEFDRTDFEGQGEENLLRHVLATTKKYDKLIQQKVEVEAKLRAAVSKLRSLEGRMVEKNEQLECAQHERASFQEQLQEQEKVNAYLRRQVSTKSTMIGTLEGQVRAMRAAIVEALNQAQGIGGNHQPVSELSVDMVHQLEWQIGSLKYRSANLKAHLQNTLNQMAPVGERRVRH